MARTEQGSIPQQPDTRHKPLVCVDRKVIDKSYERVASHMEENRKFYKETNPYQNEVTYFASANRSMTFVGMGDGHLGAMSSNQTEFKRHMDAIKNTDNVRGIGMSNFIDAFLAIHHAGGKNDSPLPALKEAYAMNDLLKKMGPDKMLGMVHSPCHEGWAETLAGIDLQQIMADGTDIPLLQNGAVMRVKFPNGAEFSAGIWHQAGKGGAGKIAPAYAHQSESRLNTTDAILIGHSHIAEVAHTFVGEHPNRKEVALIRTGSYKGNILNQPGEIADTFQTGHSGRDGELGGQSVTFNPMTGEMRVHLNIFQAIKYQEKLNRVEPLLETGQIHEIWAAAKAITSRIDSSKKRS